MLIDTLREQRTGLVYPDGLAHDDALAPLRKRASASEAYVFDPDATAMAASVSLSRPSSILAALDWVRLPHDSVWLEFVNEDLRRAMAELGSPNVAGPNAVTRIVRSAFLMRRDGDVLVADYVHLDAVQGARFVDLAPARLLFDLSDGRPDPAGAITASDVQPLVRGRMRRYLDLLTKDPSEAAASSTLIERLRWEPHPEMERVMANIARSRGRQEVERVLVAQAEEAMRLFKTLAIPALILLNCRNAVRPEVVTPDVKLNKARTKRGREPLVVHRVVKVSLSPKRKVSAHVGETAATARRGTLVNGHFKVRSSGVYWWTPHARRGYGAVTKTRIVTP